MGRHKSAFRKTNRPTLILTGGETKCEFRNCTLSFPSAKSCNGNIKRFCNQTCAQNERWHRKKETGVSAAKSEKGKLALEAKKAQDGKWRLPPYDRRKECLTDSGGRICACVNYSACSDLWEQGKPTTLELILKHKRTGHCYEASTVMATGSAIDQTMAHSFTRNFSKRGAE